MNNLKNIIAIELLNLLIEKHEDGDSLVRESDLKQNIKTNHSHQPNTSEITESVNFINSTANRRVIVEGWISTGGFMGGSDESSYITESSKGFLNSLIKSMTTNENKKKISLTFTQRDVLLFKALIRNVFPIPKKGEMLSSIVDFSQGKDSIHFIYLTDKYYNVLYNAILSAKEAGKFDSSNAAEHWLGLVRSFESAIDVNDLDYSDLKEWEA